jgi:hypothetical protein
MAQACVAKRLPTQVAIKAVAIKVNDLQARRKDLPAAKNPKTM